LVIRCSGIKKPPFIFTENRGLIFGKDLEVLSRMPVDFCLLDIATKPANNELIYSVHFFTLTRYLFFRSFTGFRAEIEKSDSGRLPGRENIHLFLYMEYTEK